MKPSARFNIFLTHEEGASLFEYQNPKTYGRYYPCHCPRIYGDLMCENGPTAIISGLPPIIHTNRVLKSEKEADLIRKFSIEFLKTARCRCANPLSGAFSLWCAAVLLRIARTLAPAGAEGM
jgi:hypothetical protein